jgi:excisionase family DNA binding protein
MEVSAEQWELFPLSASEAPAKSKFRQWMDALGKHGPLLTFTIASSALDVHRSRIYQLVDEGRIETVSVCGERFIPASAIEKFLAADRGPGIRRNTARKMLGTIYREADRLSDKIAGK